MKRLVLSILFTTFLVQATNTNDQNAYKEGMNFGKSIKPDLNSIKQTDTNQFIDGGANSNPPETRYYKGSKTNDDLLKGDGINKFNESEFKQPIVDSINNKPALSKEDDLIADSLYMQNGIVSDPNGNFCTPTVTQLVDPIYNKKSCLQDNVEYGYCTLTPTIKWKDGEEVWGEITETEKLNINFGKSDFYDAYFEFMPSRSGKLVSVTLNYRNNRENLYTWIAWSLDGYNWLAEVTDGYEIHQYNMFNRTINQYVRINPKHFEPYVNYQINIGNINKEITQKQPIRVKLLDRNYNTRTNYSGYFLENPHFADTFNCNGNICRELSITYTLLVKKRGKLPETEWNRACDFNYQESENLNTRSSDKKYKLTKNECLIGDTERVYFDEFGVAHTVRFPCFEYEETYEKPVDVSPECALLDNDKSCSQDKKTCLIFDEHNNCTQFSIDYSCATYKKIGKQCGELFYSNCETEECKAKYKNQDFGDAVSTLQAVTEAAADINDDPENIKIFSGKALHCRKATAGYNNCCKDGGWGQDIGIAGCNSEEKELGGAKEKGLAISVGEYCSKKTLGVCLQKKRSYCVFNSKLAKIVQQQGRRGQLNIGFGSKKHPDCRGMSLSEFESLNFDNINFSEFYGDLNKQIDLPSEQAIKDRITR